MRVILIAPLHRESKYFRVPRKTPFLLSQGQQGWMSALKSLGHDIYVFRFSDSILIPNKLRAWIADQLLKRFGRLIGRFRRLADAAYFLLPYNLIKNKKLLNTCAKVKPDVVIISGGISGLFPSTLKKIKDRHGSKTIMLSGINPDTSSSKNERAMVNRGYIDLVVENDEGYATLWKKMGAKQVAVLPISAIDPSLHKKISLSFQEIKKLGSDVCFVGTLTQDRQEKLSSLKDFNLKIWGDIPVGVSMIENIKPFYRGEAFGEKMVKIFNAAKIILNFQSLDMKTGGNMRTFEIPGSGGFQLVDRVHKGWFEEQREIVIFRSLKDLREKIVYYLNNPQERRKIAQAGYLKAHKNHTYAIRFKTLLSHIQ